MKTTRFSRILAGLLAALMLGSLAACAGDGGTTDTTAAPTTTAPADATPAETAPTTDKWGRELVEDDLPADLKFEGETFTILARNQKGFNYEFYSAEQTGDIVGDAVYARNRRIEDRLGVTIELLERAGGWGDRDQYSAFITNAAMTNSNEFDVVATYAYFATTAALLECYYNLYDLPNVNFEKPWWRQNYIEAATAHGQVYSVIGDLNLSVIDRTLLMYYNKRITDQYGIGNIYEMVLNGTWTVDKLMEITKDTASDINGSGSLDDKDFYGIVGVKGSESFDGWFSAFNLPLITLDADDTPVVSMNLDLATQALDKLLALYYQNNGAHVMAGVAENANKFYAGEAMFWVSTLMADETMRANLRNMTDDYGVVPLPKYSEAQENYGTTPQDAYNTVSVMRDVKNPQMVGAVLELLNAESWKTIRPEYCENTVKYRYMRDSESGQIFDLIVDSVFFDYAMIYNSALNGFGNTIRNELNNNRNQLASTMTAQTKLANMYIKKLDKVFLDREGE